MLTKHYVPRAYMKRSEDTGIFSDLSQGALGLGYCVSWELWHTISTTTSLDTGKIFLANALYYRKKGMKYRDCVKADLITLKIYEALIESGLGVVTSPQKQYFSPVYGRYYENLDLPTVRVEVHSEPENKEKQQIKIRFSGNQLKAVETDSYLVILNQILSGIDQSLIALKPTVERGWLVYKLKDYSLNYRTNLASFTDDLPPFEVYLDGGHRWNLAKEFGGLITGASGTGKTSLLYGLIFQLLQKKNVQVFVADGKNDSLGAVMSEVLPKGRVVTGVQTASLVHKLVEETDRRYKIMSQNRKKSPQMAFASFEKFRFPLTVLFLDEQSAVMASLPNPKSKKQYQNDLLKLVQTSRAAGIIPVVSMQQASATSIGGSLGTAIREQLTGLKVVLGSLSTITTQDKQMVFGSSVEFPPMPFTGVGIGYLQTSKMPSPEPFQAPLLPKRSEDLYRLLRK